MAHVSTLQNGLSQNGVAHKTVSPDTNVNILSLANKVSELAALQTHQVPVRQEEFLQAIQRLQIAVEGPAHYVARKRHEVRYNRLAC
jgi:hypothetical protein